METWKQAIPMGDNKYVLTEISFLFGMENVSSYAKIY